MGTWGPGAGQRDRAEEPALALSWLLRYLALGTKTGTSLLPPQSSRGGAGKTVQRTKQGTSRGKNSPYHHRLPSKKALESMEAVRCEKQPHGRSEHSCRSESGSNPAFSTNYLCGLRKAIEALCLSFLTCKMGVIIPIVGEFL